MMNFAAFGEAMERAAQRFYDKPSNEGPSIGGLGLMLVPEPTYQRVAPEIAAQHTMRAQAILSLGDTPKHQAMALQHLEAAFVAANPGWRA